MARSKRIVEQNAEPANVTIVTTKDVKEEVTEAAILRGHTLSQAGDEILRLGLPLYCKRVKPKLQFVEEAAA